MRGWSALVQSVCLAIALFGVSVGVQTWSNAQARSEFDATVALHMQEAVDLVARDLQRNFHALRDIEVVLNTANEAGVSTALAFHRYIADTNYFEEFPALAAIAVFEFVTSDDLDSLVAARNVDPVRQHMGYPPLVPKALANGPMHGIITTFAPLERGRNELGADIMSRPRAATVDQMIARGRLTLTAPFVFFNGQQAVSLFHPYSSDPDAAVPDGFIGTALQSEPFMALLTHDLAPYNLQISLSDAGPLDVTNSAEDAEEALISSTLSATDRIFIHDLEVGGRIWRLRIRPATPPPPLVAIDTLTVLAAIAALLAGVLLYRTRHVADLLQIKVQERTKELEWEREEAEERAQRDAMTGLLNRRGLEIAFRNQFACNHDTPPILVSFDIDHFKQINDTLGHSAGDALLAAFATCLKNRAPKDAILARFGGDEFCGLFAAPLEEVREIAEKVLEWARTPKTVDGHTMRVGASAGIAEGVWEYGTLETLVGNADIALYAAKDQGRDTVRVFDDRMRQKSIDSKKLGDDIWRGLESHEFVPFFQSQYDARSGGLVGVEVLVRWRHPQRGILTPNKFLPVASKIGATKAIDMQVLDKANAAVKRLEEAGHNIPKYNVNVSLDRMLQSDMLTSIGALPNTRARLSFEILESDFLDDPSDSLLWRLDQLRAKGIQLEVDDFGSGHASIVALKRLNPDRLKIDQSLILPLPDGASHQRLVSSIIEIGRALDIAITAEGIETAEHARIATELGADTLQGYHFGVPVAEHELFAELARQSA